MGGPQAVGDAFCKAMRQPSHGSIHSRLASVPVLYKPGVGFVSGVLFGILQYAVVMVAVLATEVFIWAHFGANVEQICVGKSFCLIKVPFYIKGVSCGWAMYNLTFFYFEAQMCGELKERLEQIHPHSKFFSVKMIIFFTFFQKIIIGTILSDMHVFDRLAGGPERWTPQQVAEGLQTFLLCVEMFMFSIWHTLAYPVEEFNRLDAAISLRAAVEKKSRADLQSAVKEAIEAGLDEECDQTERLCAEGHELLREAQQLLDSLYPEVTLEDGTSDFVLQTTGAATVHISVDASSRRMVITSYKAGLGLGNEQEGGTESRTTEDGNDVKVTLNSAMEIKKMRTLARPTQQQGVVDDLATVAHHLCSPSGQVGFLGTCAMYWDILKLRQMARDQHIAVQLLTRRGRTPCSDEELRKAFDAFDRDNSQGICKQEFRELLVATNGGSRDAAENELRQLSLEDDHELSFEEFKCVVESGVFRRSAPTIENLASVTSTSQESLDREVEDNNQLRTLGWQVVHTSRNREHTAPQSKQQRRDLPSLPMKGLESPEVSTGLGQLGHRAATHARSV
eukprot:CAMPEP_0172667198 /NCGR_PEP_ID=MMETSP1074-20121228/8273_1 /TAXON_ID=2916 /ORGANISM="Ceratium fusus, Strain PA161109" /LENGTH=564 /DNA_ID=CAMNT_0013483669 /DNA_START=306 /DNA_END=2002 /DNA_ORIENTATION=-